MNSVAINAALYMTILTFSHNEIITFFVKKKKNAFLLVSVTHNALNSLDNPS